MYVALLVVVMLWDSGCGLNDSVVRSRYSSDVIGSGCGFADVTGHGEVIAKWVWP